MRRSAASRVEFGFRPPPVAETALRALCAAKSLDGRPFRSVGAAWHSVVAGMRMGTCAGVLAALQAVVVVSRAINGVW